TDAHRVPIDRRDDGLAHTDRKGAGLPEIITYIRSTSRLREIGLLGGFQVDTTAGDAFQEAHVRPRTKAPARSRDNDHPDVVPLLVMRLGVAVLRLHAHSPRVELFRTVEGNGGDIVRHGIKNFLIFHKSCSPEKRA